MRIFYITDDKLTGGVEAVHVQAVCRQFASLGHDVTLYHPGASAAFVGEQFCVRPLSVPANLPTSPLFQLRLWWRLVRDMAVARPDIIYARHSHALIVPALYARAKGIPLVLEVNGQLLDEASLIDTSLRGRILLKFGIFRTIERFVTMRASALIAVTAGIKDYLCRFGVPPERIVVIENGVDTDQFVPSDKGAARRALGLDPSAVYVGYVGSFYPWQGVRFMVQAAAQIVARRSGVRFLFVGTGEEETYVRAFVAREALAHAVELREAVSHDMVPQVVAALDVCLCYPTSFRAGATSPFKAYEYMATGKAVVMADIAGMRGSFGDVVAYAAPDSADALAAVIEPLVDDVSAREVLGARARAYVEAGHSWRAVAERVIAVCRDVLVR